MSTTDADSGPNAQVTYSLAAGTELGFFINPVSGVIFCNTSHHYNPRRPMLQLVVMATDAGTPALSAVAAVTVQITDVNNNPPRFSSRTYKYVTHCSLCLHYHVFINLI